MAFLLETENAGMEATVFRWHIIVLVREESAELLTLAGILLQVRLLRIVRLK